MRKISLLTMLLALFSLSAFAQPNTKFHTFRMAHQNMLQTKALVRQSQPIASNNASRRAGEKVTPPETATIETWSNTSGMYYLGTTSGWMDATILMSEIKVAIDGTNMYIQGLLGIFPEEWIVGSISGRTVTFAGNQLIEDDVFLSGSNDGSTLSESIVFNYYEATGVLQAVTPFIIENSTNTEIAPYAYWFAPIFERNSSETTDDSETTDEFDLVSVPDDLVTTTYTLTTTVKEYVPGDENPETGEPTEGSYEQYSSEEYVTVGFYNEDTEVYIQGLCAWLPEAWIKGTVEDGKIIIPFDLCLGECEYWDWETETAVSRNLFLAAADTIDGEVVLKNVVFNYNAETKTITASQDVFANTSTTELSYLTWYVDMTLQPYNEVAATPADPKVKAINFDKARVGLNKIKLYIPTEDTEGEELLPNKLYYTIWYEKDGQTQQYIFTVDKYGDSDGITEDLTEIPYIHDGDNIFEGGSTIFFEEEQAELLTWTKVGVQSIYYGGGERRTSNIVWMENTATGISDITYEKNSKGAKFNLNGQHVADGYKGLIIMNGRKLLMK